APRVGRTTEAPVSGGLSPASGGRRTRVLGREHRGIDQRAENDRHYCTVANHDAYLSISVPWYLDSSSRCGQGEAGDSPGGSGHLRRGVPARTLAPALSPSL